MIVGKITVEGDTALSGTLTVSDFATERTATEVCTRFAIALQEMAPGATVSVAIEGEGFSEPEDGWADDDGGRPGEHWGPAITDE
jgi:hypothetical protein